MGKLVKKELVKFAKQLNKLDLTEDSITVKGDVEEIKEDFISAIEEIDDDGSIEEVDEDIIDYYESLIDDDDDDDEDEDEDNDDDDDDDEDEEEEEEKPKKKGKKGKKGKKEKKTKKEKKGKKGKKTKKEKKGKKEKKEKKVDLPKGLRTGTMPADLYLAIKEGDGETTWGDLAKVFGKKKKKKADKVMGGTFRTVSRKVAKAVPIQVTFNGEDEDATFAISDSEEDDD